MAESTPPLLEILILSDLRATVRAIMSKHLTRSGWPDWVITRG
jgi:hypothetical protein